MLPVAIRGKGVLPDGSTVAFPDSAPQFWPAGHWESAPLASNLNEYTVCAVSGTTTVHASSVPIGVRLMGRSTPHAFMLPRRYMAAAGLSWFTAGSGGGKTVPIR